MNPQPKSANCPVCEVVGDGAVVKQLSDRRKGLPGTWDVLECGNCGALYLDPMPSDNDLTRYYSEYYSSPKSGELVITAGFGDTNPRLRRVYHWLSGDVDPRDFVRVPAGGKVLDFGSGGGTYLSYFHSRGIDIIGAEVSEPMLTACLNAGLKVSRVDSFDTVPFADNEFDVVYLMQVFEHLRNPRQSMQELARILKPNGSLYVAVPNASSAWRKIFDRNWVSGWFAPFHLVHYTTDSLSQLAGESGLRVVNSWSRTPESWFRLNLKAALRRTDTRLESNPWMLDTMPFRIVLGLLLRIVDSFHKERDCLMVELVK
ncbi:AdoMet_MTases domain containing protein [Mycobacteriaceae bacterium]